MKFLLTRWLARHACVVLVVVLVSTIVLPAALVRYVARQPYSRVPPLPVSRPGMPVKPRAAATALLSDGAIRRSDVPLRQVFGQIC